MLAGAGRDGSIHKVFKYDVVFQKERNRRECLLLAKVLDAIRKKQYKLARELLCRRIAGVHSADTSGNWSMCDAFEQVLDKQSFVPDGVMQRVLKSVSRMKAVEEVGNYRKVIMVRMVIIILKSLLRNIIIMVIMVVVGIKIILIPTIMDLKDHLVKVVLLNNEQYS